MKLKIFALGGSVDFATKVAEHLDIPLSSHVERRFDDGEIYVRSDENVRGCDVYVIDSLYGESNISAGEKLATLMFFLGSLSDASAGRITVVSPYLAFARQDRKTESRAPITIKYVAKALESAGADRLLTMDVHNLAAFQNAFRIPTDNLEARPLFVNWLIENKLPDDLVVLSPDAGGMQRTRKFRGSLERRIEKMGKKSVIDIAYFDKQRTTTGVIGSKIIGDVKDRNVILIDDLISTATTIKLAADAVEREGGIVNSVFATHGLFIGEASENVAKIKRLVVSDTIPAFRLNFKENLFVVPTTKMFATAIRRTHEEGGSISQLLSD